MNRVPAGTLVLEPQLAVHAAQMFEVLSDPAIYEFENTPPVSAASLAERFARLESRVSPDRTEQWLNWVIRLPTGALAGYVQATIAADGTAHIAYELGSAFWPVVNKGELALIYALLFLYVACRGAGAVASVRAKG